MRATLPLRVLVSVPLLYLAAPAPGGDDAKAATPATAPTAAASPTAAAQAAPASRPATRADGGSVAVLEAKLLGTWEGGPCVGTYTFVVDGTFVLDSFTPGGNTLTGVWSVRWDALPPTLVLTCKTSDFTAKDPARPEYAYLGKDLEVQLVELNDRTLAYRRAMEKRETRFQRPTKD